MSRRRHWRRRRWAPVEDQRSTLAPRAVYASAQRYGRAQRVAGL